MNVAQGELFWEGVLGHTCVDAALAWYKPQCLQSLRQPCTEQFPHSSSLLGEMDSVCVVWRQFNAVFRQESHIPKQTAVNGTDQLDWCGLCWAPCSVKGEAGTALFVTPERSGSATSAVCGSERPWAGPRELGFCVPVRSVGSTHCKLVAEGLRCNSDTPWKSPVPGNVQSQRKPVL